MASPLQDWAKRVPFIPFTVTLSSGRHVEVANPEMIILGNHWDLVAFVDGDGLDRLVIMYHNHIASVDAFDPVQTSDAPH